MGRRLSARDTIDSYGCIWACYVCIGQFVSMGSFVAIVFYFYGQLHVCINSGHYVYSDEECSMTIMPETTTEATTKTTTTTTTTTKTTTTELVSTLGLSEMLLTITIAVPSALLILLVIILTIFIIMCCLFARKRKHSTYTGELSPDTREVRGWGEGRGGGLSSSLRGARSGEMCMVPQALLREGHYVYPS